MTKHQEKYVLAALLLFSVLLVLIVGVSNRVKEKFIFKAVLLVVVMSELIYQGWIEYSPKVSAYVEQFAAQGEALSMLTNDAAGSLVKNHAKNTTYRYESLQSEEWKNGVGSALTAYAADQTDANWDAVVSAFVDGWASEYKLANE